MRESQKSFIVDVRMGFKYASAVSFIVENVCRTYIVNLPYIVKVNFMKVKNLSLILLFLELMKNMLI